MATRTSIPDATSSAAMLRKLFRLLVRETMFEHDRLTVDVAGICEAFHERLVVRSLLFCVCSMPENTDTGELSGLLCARCNRPRRRATEQRDELAPPHSITSSARASNEGGTSMPSIFAVLRLMTSSYLVGAWTGKSLGFSPLRTRST